MVRIFSSGIRSIPCLESFLNAFVGTEVRASSSRVEHAVAGWGLRGSAHRAIRYAREHGLTYLALEDGFLRSLSPGKAEAPLSMVIDNIGIYYDANRASLLEKLISQPLTEKETRRSQDLISRWREGRVSKYNHQRDGKLPESIHRASSCPEHGGYVLVVDQVRGDASIKYGQASDASFQRMIEAALVENPTYSIVVKSHPEVISGKKHGHLKLDALLRHPRVMVLTEDLHPSTLLEQAAAVYVVTSQMGFEGLIWGKTVRTFGMPFYAGWGLTQDDLPAPVRRGKATLEQLVYASLIAYPRYVNPESRCACEVEDVLDHLALQRRMRGRFPGQVYAKGFSLLKRRTVRRFFSGSSVQFTGQNEGVPEGAVLALWGSNTQTGHMEQGNVVRLEDGFLRSVGLGAELVRPLSWVMDRRGIYYDATRPSDLEHLLQNGEFDRELCLRAARLRQRIVLQGVTKYNVGTLKSSSAESERVHNRNSPYAEQRVILVPGQVETDASIRFGASSIRTNIDLLRAVRRDNPSAYIIYKPHPDVVSGIRAAGKDENKANAYYDELVENVSIHALLTRVDEVHVLTSLTGFEALLRGKHVTTYGQPFYAGWGLTTDRALTEELARRRNRKLTLDELVAGALILYPTYVSDTTGRFTTPERVLDELLEWRERAAEGATMWRAVLRWLMRAWRERQ